MKPVNSKSLFHSICNEIEEIKTLPASIDRANTSVSLHNSALKVLYYEVNRAKALSEEAVKKEFRNIELKDFDNCQE